ncbi:hypothetical protein Poli38472_000454 [Pythium oligandrum]|uniref:RNase NYN domain-containing protein n=1 Tax=Pythium oligandrum TaxID=41045 RepID=A0A8K1CBZ3_PYTOL|nr:hypothetical protein Poli38472_000454 [Pythium oligandrum]|eukprot:TMW60412.1 hypothetical protein Poli38472_000454 [Pythium oligandrum]
MQAREMVGLLDGSRRSRTPRRGGSPRTTPTRRRRRGPVVYERWDDGDDDEKAPTAVPVDRPPVPIVTLPSRGRINRTSSSTEDTNSSDQCDAEECSSIETDEERAVALSELQSVESILAATKLLQRLDRLEVELRHENQAIETELRESFRDTCTELIKRFPWLSLSKKVDERLWQNYRAEFQALESQVAFERSRDQTEEYGSIFNVDSEKCLRTALSSALHAYCSLSEDVRGITMVEKCAQQLTVGRLMHRLNLAQAHILYSLQEHNQRDARSWFMAELYYETARRWTPTEGLPHYHLARVTVLDGRPAEALYHFVRNALSRAPFGNPTQLAELFLQIRNSLNGANEERNVEDKCWDVLDRHILHAAGVFFVHEEPAGYRVDLSVITSSLCVALDTLFHDKSPCFEDRVTRKSMRLMRMACLFIGGSVLQSARKGGDDKFQKEASEVEKKKLHAIALVSAFVGCLVHRLVMALTSPVREFAQKQEALGFFLPIINVALPWLLEQSWEDVAEHASTNRRSLEHLITILRSTLLMEDFATSDGNCCETIFLSEDIEIAGFASLDDPSKRKPHQHIPTLIEAQDVTSNEELEIRIARFFKATQSMSSEHEKRPSVTTIDVNIQDGEDQEQSEDGPGSREDDVDVGEIVEDLENLSTTSGAHSEDSATTSNSPTTSVEQMSDYASPVRTSVSQPERVVVLDAANIAMRHGRQRRFSSRGIKLCAEYFLGRGDRVVAFLPDYCLDRDADGNPRRRRRRDRPTTAPDDPTLLQTMVDSGLIILTPAQDSDDLYCIHYARRHDAFVVTNDLFRDHISDTEGPKSRQNELRTWLMAHRISYTWVGDEFFANPNSSYEKRLTTPLTAQTWHC